MIHTEVDVQKLLARAEESCFPSDVEYLRDEVQKAQMAIVTAIATPAKKQAERRYKKILARLWEEEREFEDDKYQSESAHARAEYDAVQQAAAWSRGADYQTEMRQRSRIHYLYG